MITNEKRQITISNMNQEIINQLKWMIYNENGLTIKWLRFEWMIKKKKMVAWGGNNSGQIWLTL